MHGFGYEFILCIHCCKASSTIYLYLHGDQLHCPVSNTMCRDCVGVVPLHLAVQNGCNDVVQLLVHEGCDVTARYPVTGLFPLHMAASKGFTHIARIIIDDGGASVFDIDVKKRTPVSKAVPMYITFTCIKMNTRRAASHSGSVNHTNSYPQIQVAFENVQKPGICAILLFSNS